MYPQVTHIKKNYGASVSIELQAAKAARAYELL